MRLSTAFYKKVAHDPTLKPLFPGKSLHCATEEFAAFLIQFLGGDEAKTQRRWWLSLRESHARFRITLLRGRASDSAQGCVRMCQEVEDVGPQDFQEPRLVHERAKLPLDAG